MTASNDARPPTAPSPPLSYDGGLGRHIIAIHRWAVDQGLRGAPAEAVFEGVCRRLVEAGVPLWRGFAGLQTLHPQWAGYSYTWRRDVATVDPVQRERGVAYDRDLHDSPFSLLMREGHAAAGAGGWPR